MAEPAIDPEKAPPSQATALSSVRSTAEAGEERKPSNMAPNQAVDAQQSPRATTPSQERAREAEAETKPRASNPTAADEAVTNEKASHGAAVAPASAAAPPLVPPPPPPPPTPPLPARLKKVEKYWAWKVGIRVLICVVAAGGIGSAAWVTATGLVLDDRLQWYNGNISYFGDKERSAIAIAFLSVSLVWSTTEALARFIRRPPRPVHPGIAVGVDLILWIVLLISGYFMILAVRDLQGYGANIYTGYMDDPSGSQDGILGHYRLEPANDTWVFTVTDLRNSTGKYSDPPPGYVPLDRVCRGSNFQTCDEMERLINGIWHQKPARVAADAVTAAMQMVALVGHFALFVWACVDCAERNRREPARALAQEMLADMIDRGDVVLVNPGELDMPPRFLLVPPHIERERRQQQQRRRPPGRQRRRGGRHTQDEVEDPSHWESLYGAYDPVDRATGRGAGRRRDGGGAPEVPFQLAPYVLPYGRRTPGYGDNLGAVDEELPASSGPRYA